MLTQFAYSNSRFLACISQIVDRGSFPRHVLDASRPITVPFDRGRLSHIPVCPDVPTCLTIDQRQGCSTSVWTGPGPGPTNRSRPWSGLGLGPIGSVRSRSHTSWTDRSDWTGPVGPM